MVQSKLQTIATQKYLEYLCKDDLSNFSLQVAERHLDLLIQQKGICDRFSQLRLDMLSKMGKLIRINLCQLNQGPCATFFSDYVKTLTRNSFMPLECIENFRSISFAAFKIQVPKDRQSSHNFSENKKKWRKVLFLRFHK